MPEETLKTDAASLWESAKAAIASCMPKSTYASWFEQMECEGFDSDVLKISAASDFAADWVRNSYSDIIQKYLNLAAGCSVKFEIVARKDAARAESLDGEAFSGRVCRAPRAGGALKAAPAPVINPRNTFENFVVGEGNSLAHAVSLAVAKSPGSAYNPFCLYSASGLGKTHLMHAVAHFIFLSNPSSSIVYISSERFVNEFIRAIQENNLTSFRKRYRSVDVLMIDDVQFFSGKERCQAEFFHTFNDLFEAGKQIILSSDRPVNEIPDLEERLVSRFEWGMPVDIQPPDYETRLAILSKKSEAMSAQIPLEVLDLIARKITKNIRRMEGALNRLKGYTSLVSAAKPLDVATAERLLADTFLQEKSSQTIGVDKIQKLVADYYHVEVGDLLGPRRPANIALARQVAMYISRKLTTHSLQEIGQLFGGRNHGTVMHAMSTVENAMKTDEYLAGAVEYLLKTVR